MGTIAINDRLVIHALIDGLVADGPTFDARAAEDLISRLPFSSRSSALQIMGSWRGSDTTTGHAAGVGNASVTDETDKAISVGTDGRWRIGGYKIDHSPGTIEIALMWEDTFEDASGKVCQLTYDPVTKRPLAMLLARDLSFAIGPLHVTYGRKFDPWKLPA